MNEALRDWVTNVDDTYYLIGTAAGPHPYPEMVRDFQSVIGDERAREQMLEPKAGCPTRWSPASAAAPTPSALFHPFLDDASQDLRRRSRRPRHRRRNGMPPR
jgi:tryptophan synthase beta chain